MQRTCVHELLSLTSQLSSNFIRSLLFNSASLHNHVSLSSLPLPLPPSPPPPPPFPLSPSAPLLSFQSHPLTAREGDGSTFSILRTGVNLHLETTVCYQVNETLTTAASDTDYSLRTGVQQAPNQWCVTFAPNQTKVACTFLAHTDIMLEVAKFVFLDLLGDLRYGELGSPTSLNITILDGTQRMLPDNTVSTHTLNSFTTHSYNCFIYPKIFLFVCKIPARARLVLLLKHYP